MDANGLMESWRVAVSPFFANKEGRLDGPAGDLELHTAAKTGSVTECARLLNEGAEVRAQNPWSGMQALHFAAMRGSVEICRILDSHGADANAKNFRRCTPLHVASMLGHVEVVRVLLDAVLLNGADVHARTDIGITALHFAAANGHPGVCCLLIAAGADTNAKDDSLSAPLHAAVSDGHANVCRILIEEHTTDIDIRGDQDFTPLHIAATHGHIHICRMLITHGANTSARTAIGLHGNPTPLEIAAGGRGCPGHIDVCRMLLNEDRGNLGFTIGRGRLLHAAARGGNIDICRMLIVEFGADASVRDHHLSTPLHSAAQHHGSTDICHMLVKEFNADVDARNDTQSTPLHVAAVHANTSTCMVLVYVGADLQALDMEQNTAADAVFYISADRGQRSCCSAQEAGARAQLSLHLKYSGGVHRLHCTGPHSLQRTPSLPPLLWNGTTETEKRVVIDEMQEGWLTKVAEGQAHARVGLTLRGKDGWPGIYDGKLSTDTLVHILGFVFGGTSAHALACLSTVPLPRSLGTGAVAVPSSPVVLMSYALAMTLHKHPSRPVDTLASMQREVLKAATDANCEWLCDYCKFIEERYEWKKRPSPQCEQCGKEGMIDMLECSKCQLMRYCSQECQTIAWSIHHAHLQSHVQSRRQANVKAAVDVLAGGVVMWLARYLGILTTEMLNLWWGLVLLVLFFCVIPYICERRERQHVRDISAEREMASCCMQD
jgi:ankyrin repeat protein